MPDPSPAPSLPFSYKVYAAFTTVACVVLCFLLLRANAANRSLQHSFSEAIEKIGSAGLAVGERVDPLAVIGLRGGDSLPVPAEALTFNDGRTGTLLLLLSGACDTCRFSIPYFTRLAALAETKGLVSVGVQIDAASEADLKYDGLAGFPVAAVQDSPHTWLRRVPIVPAIILLDPRGGVTKTYFGELSPKQQDELEASVNAWTPNPTSNETQKAPTTGP